MNTTLFFENYLILIVAIFKRARLDARRGDRSAAQFLQYFGAHRRNLQQFQKQESL